MRAYEKLFTVEYFGNLVVQNKQVYQLPFKI